MNQQLPLPSPRVARFESMAMGLFVHWGLYATIGKAEWALHAHRIPKEAYRKAIENFTARDFDAHTLARAAKQAGMRYITLTTRHHEGFSLYDTCGLSDFDAPHSPARRDLVREFVEACRDEGLLPVLYHTTLDWMAESYATDFNAYLDYLRKSVEILCTRYGPIGGLWFDGNWDKPGADWKLDELYGMIRRLQPEALIINNTGLDARGEVGHPEIDSVTFERGLPGPLDRQGKQKYITGEMCQTMNDHWGFTGNDFNYKSPAELIENLCACRRVGANFLLNIGPEAGGAIPPMQAATLGVIGSWMDIFGKAIYDGRPAAARGTGRDFVLEAPDGRRWLFIHGLKVTGVDHVVADGESSSLRSFDGIGRKVSRIRWMDNGEELAFTEANGLLCLRATGYPYGTNYVVRVAEVE